MRVCRHRWWFFVYMRFCTRGGSTDTLRSGSETHGFMLNRSRTATLALASRPRWRSVKSFSLVQVMCTPAAASLRAAWDAVFLSWISWA